jgi:hypothetical protein
MPWVVPGVHLMSLHSVQGEQTHVCTSSKTATSDDVVMEELRYVGLPTSSLHRVPPQDTVDLLETSLASSPGSPEEEYY